MPDWLDFDRFTEWVSGEWWSYLVIFGVAVVDAFFPLVPSETTRRHRREPSRAPGDLVCWLVILAAAAGAIVGDNISFWIGHFVGEKTVKRGSSAARSGTSASSGPSERSTSAARTSSSSPASSPAAVPPSPSPPATCNTFPWRRFIVYDVAAGLLGRRTARCSATSEARRSRTTRSGELPSLWVSHLTLGFVVEGVRHYSAAPGTR